MSEGSTFGALKQVLVGKPIPSHLAHHERLSKVTGLAVLSSDPLSSVAYATEEIVRTLILAGAGALALSIPIATVIAALLLLVAFSYRQTIHAYPGGGGAYIVAKENLGPIPGLAAAAALLIDYVMTVAVSIAAGVAAVVSAFPRWHVSRTEMCLAFVVLIAIGNLRGIRESGRIFAAPTYFFLASLLSLIAAGAWRAMSGDLTPVPPSGTPTPTGVAVLGTFLVLRAFANGCTAMTGVEAISNGVPAFKPPEARNAATTLIVMAFLCVTLFVGITLLAHAYRVVPQEESAAGYETVVSQVARGVLGGRGPLYYCVQAATMLILVLAANTAFQDFPRLSSILARDRYMPRQFMNQGDRLAFSNGILVLSALAGILIVVFKGDTHALIALYMIGVFVSFTLSQAGMVRKWRREGGRGWLGSALFNLVGAVSTCVVLVVVAVTKFAEGAWIIVVLIPLVVLWFQSVHNHYARVGAQLSLRGWRPEPRNHNTVLVPIGGVHRAVVQAIQYAKMLSGDVRAVYVDVDPKATEETRREWERWGQGVPLVVLQSAYRSLMEPLLEYIEQVDAERPDDFVTIVLPEFVPARWWHHLLHNQRALLIKGALLFKPNTVVTSVPFHLSK
ncbi:MAG: amino acid permease [Acidobacteria bacterium]|nr:MAG: amino acid permease [Acidobacteriota bacterium]